MDAADIAPRRKIKLLGYAISAALVILIATVALKQQGRPSNERVALSALVAESEAVAPPEGAALLNRIENHKTSSAIVSATYKSLYPRAEVAQHYSVRLKNAGWSPMQSDNKLIEAYCKDSLTAYLEFKPELQLFDFSIVWKQQPRTEC